MCNLKISLSVMPFCGALLLSGCAGTGELSGGNKTGFEEEISLGVEEIYLFRTVRTERNSGATPFCASAGFESIREDYYTLWSLAASPQNGKVNDTHMDEVGGFRACFGAISLPDPIPMYAEGTTADVPWTGKGECIMMQAQPPIRTALTFNCNLAVSGLPDGYAGGWLTSSTLAPLLGSEYPPGAHIPGYLSTSVVTMRLWKNP